MFLVDSARLRGGGTVTVDGAEGRHAAVVRRIRPGETVELTDGEGRLARCVVAESSRDGLVCEVRSRHDVPPPSPRLTVVQALPKGERGELAVELLTEVGVDAIVPWPAARCVARWEGERGAKALRRWRTTAREASKQARRARLPEVAEAAPTAEVARLLGAATLGVVLHEKGDRDIGAVQPPAQGQIVLVVGPEGGIDDNELAAFTAAGAVAVRMGPTVLRTSTAGAVAAGVLLSGTERWSSVSR